MKSEKTLKQTLIELFPDAKFDRHETDLYVKFTPEIWQYLKTNYEFFSNIHRFNSQADRETWIDIPFAAWDEKYKNR